MKHTPGPWNIDALLEDETREIRKGSRDLATVYTWSHDFEESLANAHLIAAAPELLESGNELYAAIGDILEALPNVEVSAVLGLQLVKARENWNKAKAKAEGREKE